MNTSIETFDDKAIITMKIFSLIKAKQIFLKTKDELIYDKIGKLNFGINEYKYEIKLKKYNAEDLLINNNQLFFGIRKMIVPIKIKDNSYYRTYGVTYGKDRVSFLVANRIFGISIQQKSKEIWENKLTETIITKVEEVETSKVDSFLFFEKNGKGFEESAKTLFEKMYEQGNRNIYFVLSKETVNIDEIIKKYGDNIILQGTKGFFEKIFECKYYIGTESQGHILTLRTPYAKLRKEIFDTKKHKFIFLQHGIMYALSMNTNSRAFFWKKSISNPFRVVVSSKLEAEHFKKYGGYKKKDLLITGLAKFDNSIKDKEKTKIVIMLTWRPWDENKKAIETTYYTAIEKILKNISSDQLKNVIIIPHPKLKKEIINSTMKKYISQKSIDETLSETKVLITDYSSVCFDSFYRGSNVVFWWEEKQECLELYKNTLMLNEKNIFGDIVYESKEINKIVKINYKMDQKQKYKEKYLKINEFNDGENTIRIIKKINKLTEGRK